MKLRELLADTEVAEIAGDGEVEIAGLAYDSRRVEPGTLFFCVPGQRSDGHEFGERAVRGGASALVVERPLDLPVTQVRVADARAAMASAAARFWGDPTAKLRVAGVTGTNGKTTTAFLIRHILEAQGTRTGLLGTVKRVVGGVEEDVERTTPEAIDLQQTFRRMLDRGDAACAMEVSSHALALERTSGVRFAVAVFTNLTQDHLDFHTNMEEYFLAKRSLFSSEAEPDGSASGRRRPPDAAVVNIDDGYGARLVAELREADAPPLLTLSPGGAKGADFRALDASFDASGSRFRCVGPGGEVEVRIPLPGHFNVENALAAIGACHALGVPAEAAAAALAGVGRVPGRFEPVDEGQPFAVLVDYAHTPDSLDNALRAARMLTEGRLIAVFGCGGDRDREKRPLMGEIAARLADACVVTSDNPRSEEPRAIIDEVLAGMIHSEDMERRDPAGGLIDSEDLERRDPAGGLIHSEDLERRDPAGGLTARGIHVEPDRRAAIALAFGAAAPGDTVVIAGKGHEQGQELAGGRKIPFDDREVAKEELRRLRSGSGV
ncbi:MAG: UDP-N-acetylmuramoyl-L-alanyl-D-glutamate--2,6-diaminopimelate ligase [Actinobacteria bacterium 13_1_20CM_3_68_9]|nr:MAG: UDP-N-acetylmuramoyl-L-alanyl-D-glutamate--2,6-diaminopimelate ligase [Actinobacteria bacterium 13_1_20CM_3_68_9]